VRRICVPEKRIFREFGRNSGLNCCLFPVNVRRRGTHAGFLFPADGTDAVRSTLMEVRQKPVPHLATLPPFEETIMSQEKPNDDPRQRTD
jgi:hypothetical protein